MMQIYWLELAVIMENYCPVDCKVIDSDILNIMGSEQYHLLMVRSLTPKLKERDIYLAAYM